MIDTIIAFIFIGVYFVFLMIGIIEQIKNGFYDFFCY